VAGQRDGAGRYLDEAAERAKVRAEVRDDRGSPAQHGVAGEHGAVHGQADRVLGVARRVEHLDVQAGRGDHLVGGEGGRTDAEVRRERTHRRPDAIGEPRRALHVVGMLVRHEDQRHVTRGLGDGGEVRLVVVAGIDDHARVGPRRTQQPRVGALERHGTRVVLQHDRGGGGDLTQLAVRGVPGHRPSRSSGRASRCAAASS
jgi:hypothetical protein